MNRDLPEVSTSARVDVIVVSYNSRDSLRRCVGPLAGRSDIQVVVVDNASLDRSLEEVEGLQITGVQTGRNGGFAYGCNIGWRMRNAPFVLFLNPDATMTAQAVLDLADVLAGESGLGAVGPRILQGDGSLSYTQRRFPRVCSTFALAIFLHRVFPGCGWFDETVRDLRRYESPSDADWISGACLMVRRTLLDRVDGFDEGFFLYLEDTDICKRIWDAGYRVGYSPVATCVHVGGESAPRSSLLPVHVASKVRYTQKHAGQLAGVSERVGLALWTLIRVVVSPGMSTRLGHIRALVRLFQCRPRLTP